MLSFEQMKVFLNQHKLPVPPGWSDEAGWKWAEALAAVKQEETAKAINSSSPFIAFSLDELTDNSTTPSALHPRSCVAGYWYLSIDCAHIVLSVCFGSLS